jgi:hypothetical protein
MNQLRAHAEADEIVKGVYWQDGKGCGVGCLSHDPEGGHKEVAYRTGVPLMLVRLEDTIFEGLSNVDAKRWAVDFWDAIEPGADLSRVGWRFLYWLLTDKSVNPGIDHPLVKDSVKQCADVLIPLMNGEPTDKSAAESAAESAKSAAWSAAWSADAAASAAWSADAAASAAWLAKSAAWSAAWSAESEAAKSASAETAYVWMSQKLIALLRQAPRI